MLARHAEDLFWAGRYLERAEDTARLLEVHVSVLLEDTTAVEPEMCRRVMAALGVLDPEDAGGVLRPLDVAADPVQRLGDPTQHVCLPSRR